MNSNPSSKFYLYIPSTYTDSKPVGLALLFHGVEGTTDPKGFMTLAASRGNKDRFILVSPNGDVNDGGYGAWCQPFAYEIMSEVLKRYNVDLKRMYISGLSGGAMPAIFYGLGKGPFTYTNICNQKVKAGFQDQFAAAGFVSSAYSPSDSDFSNMPSQTANQLGFTPSLWADYGANSRNGPQATDLGAWANRQGYKEVEIVSRPGEGHSPEPPYAFIGKMFDKFAKNSK